MRLARGETYESEPKSLENIEEKKLKKPSPGGKSKGQNKGKNRRRSKDQELGKTGTDGRWYEDCWDRSQSVCSCFYGRTRWRMVGSAGLKAYVWGEHSGRACFFSFSTYSWSHSFVSNLWGIIPTFLHHLGTFYFSLHYFFLSQTLQFFWQPEFNERCLKPFNQLALKNTAQEMNLASALQVTETVPSPCACLEIKNRQLYIFPSLYHSWE